MRFASVFRTQLVGLVGIAGLSGSCSPMKRRSVSFTNTGKFKQARRVLCIGFVLSISFGPSAASNGDECFSPIDIRHVEVGGPIGRRIDNTIKNNLMVLDMERDFFEPFRSRSKHGGYIGAGKLIDSLVRFAAHTSDEKVLALKRRVVNEIIKTQEADGYIGLMVPEARMWKLWDLHEMAYLVLGLSADHEFFGEESSLEAARKLADYIIRRWSAEPDKKQGEGTITEHMAETGIGPALLALYRQTGDRRYVDFCTTSGKAPTPAASTEDGEGKQDAGKPNSEDGGGRPSIGTKSLNIPEWDYPIVVGRHGQIGGHAYTFMCRSLAQLRIHQLAPDDKLFAQSRKALDFLLHDEGLVITGTCGDHECWHDSQAGTQNLGETCTTAYLIRWLGTLLCLEGDARYSDIMERAIYNALFAAQSPDGRRIRYYSPFDGPREYFDKDTYCCPCNYRRIVAELPGMVFYRSAGGLLVNLYAPASTTIELSSGIKVTVRQETDYPNSGKVVIHVSPSQPTSFPVQFRVPGWCPEAKVSVNGREEATARPGFHTVEREWKSDDRVELDMPMPWRLVKGRKAQSGRVAVMRGPVVFCLSRTGHTDLADTDLRLVTLDPSSLTAPVTDDSVRPDGLACKVDAWGPGNWYPFAKPDLHLTLTEYPDPDGVATYFHVPNPNNKQFVNDELVRP